MGQVVWTLLELLTSLLLLLIIAILSLMFFQAYRRRFNYSHDEREAIFEDPNSLNPIGENGVTLFAESAEKAMLDFALFSAMSVCLVEWAMEVAWLFMQCSSKLSNVGCLNVRRSCCLQKWSFKANSQVPWPSIYDPAEKYLSLIIPAFNEEHRLPNALDETMKYLQDRSEEDKSFTYEVVIVDDGSVDRTKDVALAFVKKYNVENVRVLLLGRNCGKGEAIKKGMLHSRGELLLMLDADGATKVNDLEKLETQIRKFAEQQLAKENGSTGDSNLGLSLVPVAAFGSRAHLEEKALATRKWYRNFLMKGFHLVVLLAAGPGIRDTQCGFKMFTRAAARQLFRNVRLKRWCFDVELVYLCKWLEIPMLEISVTWCEIPGSKVNILSIPNMLWELLLMSVGYRTRMWKIVV
ncbi:hypothetical protein KSS87_015025 [Heliosperma pusillum]|nr:hypothetical protein KSS87_015025 [Heliosperma pusillum]